MRLSPALIVMTPLHSLAHHAGGKPGLFYPKKGFTHSGPHSSPRCRCCIQRRSLAKTFIVQFGLPFHSDASLVMKEFHERQRPFLEPVRSW